MSAPKTLEQHQATINPFREALKAIPVDHIVEPDVPVDIALNEATSVAECALQHRPALEAVGLPADIHTRLAQQIEMVNSAQALWTAEMSRNRTEESMAFITRVQFVRQDVLYACDLAFRKNAPLEARVAGIREGVGLADLAADAVDLSLLMNDPGAKELLLALHYDVEGVSTELANAAPELRAILAREDAAKTLTGSKDLRDRAYSLMAETVADVRRFAAYAFRYDKIEGRRKAFASGYLRRKWNAQTRKRVTDDALKQKAAPGKAGSDPVAIPTM